MAISANLLDMSTLALATTKLNMNSFQVLKGEKFEDLIDSANEVAESSEVIKQYTYLTPYFTHHIDEYRYVKENLGNKELVKMLNKVVEENDSILFSNYSLASLIETAKLTGDEKTAIIMLVMKKVAPEVRLTRICNVFNNCNSTFITMMYDMAIKNCIAKNDVVRFSDLGNVVFNIEDNASYDEILTVLHDDSKMALAQYFGIFNHSIRFSLLAKCPNASVVLHILNRIWFDRVRMLDDAREKMNDVLSHLNEVNLDNKTLKGFYNHFDVAFFESNTKIDFLNISLGNNYSSLIAKAKKCNNAKVILKVITNNLTSKKWAFLKVLDDTLEKVDKVLRSNSLLENDEVMKMVNFNEVNANDIITFAETSWESRFSVRNEQDEYLRLTPKELIAITKSVIGCNYLYVYLTAKVDEKILIIRELASIGAELNFKRDDSIRLLGERLSQERISKRKGHLAFECSGKTLINVLSLPHRFDSLVEQAQSENELAFIVRNKDSLDVNISLVENMNNFLTLDSDCKTLFKLLNLSDDFKKKFERQIHDFCIVGNASIVVTYYNNSRNSYDTVKKNMLTIAKAAMTGQMELFKFHELSKEVERNITDEEKAAWKDNETIVENGYYGWESYSFEDTMNIGVVPNHTCMNYADGGYNNCLLANFDANKKVLYIKKGDRVVARAIIRLTKSTVDENNVTKTTFLDVENGDIATDKVVDSSMEKLTIFLERPYFAYLDDAGIKACKTIFCHMMMEKAKKMGARFLASHDYGCVSGLDEVSYKVFISHTKNGYQYMDSFGGSHNASDEAYYDEVNCYGIKE